MTFLFSRKAGMGFNEPFYCFKLLILEVLEPKFEPGVGLKLFGGRPISYFESIFDKLGGDNIATEAGVNGWYVLVGGT